MPASKADHRSTNVSNTLQAMRGHLPQELCMKKVINKSMDYSDLFEPESQEIINELNELILELERNNVRVSSWYGQFDLSGDPLSFEVLNRGIGYQPLPQAANDRNFPWFLYWEIVWVYRHADFKRGQTVLDLGGSSSLFSYYLASKGMNVTTIDLNASLVENANTAASKMGWSLRNHVMDMRQLEVKEQFDHITSICVFEHIPMFDRVEINREIKRILKPMGRFSITIDYKNPSLLARISSPEDIFIQFVEPSGLKLRGNSYFFDNSKHYLLHPFFSPPFNDNYQSYCIKNNQFDPSLYGCLKEVNDYTFAALFFENA